MCSAPKMPKTPLAPERQQMQNPKDMAGALGLNTRRRRGMWASIFTGAQGLGSAPTVTGASGGPLGG